MEQINFPDKYENLMRLARQTLADHQYFQAKTLLQRAYEQKTTFEANRLLVFCLIEMDEKKEALNQAFAHEKEYMNEEETAAFYFDLLIQTNDYLYARKLIANHDFSDSFEQIVLDKIQQTETFMRQKERQKIREIRCSVELLPRLSPTEQLRMVSKIEKLPYHEFTQTVRKLIVQPEIHLFVRAKLLELLVQVKNNQLGSYLTIDKLLIEVTPNTLPKPQEQLAYQKLSRLAENYEVQNAPLSAVLKEEFVLQCALLYPVYDTYVGDPKSWFDHTVSIYEGATDKKRTEEEKIFAKKRKIILREIRLFQEQEGGL
ncbi:hypothetical protein AALA44_03745 [Enterococcus ratti]|uniref:hypothetical protein n=1 Tax=Enterococcus ratti TaxID=150033 RepID=UPI00351720ED